MTEKIEAKVTHRFPAAPERVYDAFLDPAMAWRWSRAWLRQAGRDGDVTACEIDPEVGGKFLFADRRGEAEARHRGTFLELERPTKIGFTWIVDSADQDDPAIVTLIVEPEPDGPGSIVTLYDTMDARRADEIAETEKGWIAMLQGLDEVLRQS
jgi:Uncharacterized conserved protein